MSALRRTRVSLFLAARSLARGNAGVTAMSIAMMAAIFISVMFLPSLIAGATSGLNSQVVGTLTGGLSITPSSRSVIRDGTAYLEQIRVIPGVDAATGMRRIGNEVTHGSDEVAVGIDAVDPVSYAAVFSTPQNLIEGAWLDPNDRDGIVLGIGVAGADQPRQRTYSSSLKTVHAGDTVQVTLAGGGRHDLVVRGIYQNNFPLSDSGAFVTLAAADALVSGTDVAGQLRTAFDSLDDLASALHEASTTSQALADGVDGITTAIGTLASSADALASGTSTANAGAARLSSGAAEISSSASTLAADGRALANALAAAVSAVAKPATDAAVAAAAAAGAAASDAAKLAATCPASDPDYCAAVSRHVTLATDAASAATASADASRALPDVATKASDGASRLANGLERLARAAQELASGASRLSDGAADLARAPTLLASAADRLHVNARKIAAGTAELTAGLSKAADATAASTRDRDATLAKLDALGAPPGEDAFTRVVVTTTPGTDVADVQEQIASIRSDVRI